MMFIYVVTDNISGYWELLWIWCGQIPCVHVQMYITMAKVKITSQKQKFLTAIYRLKNYKHWIIICDKNQIPAVTVMCIFIL